MTMNIPLQQQIDECIAEGASRLPAGLLRDLLSPIGQLIASGLILGPSPGS